MSGTVPSQVVLGCARNPAKGAGEIDASALKSTWDSYRGPRFGAKHHMVAHNRL